MKRDMDLAREILFKIEAEKTPGRGWHNIEIAERSDEEVSYHIKLLCEGGLIEAEDNSDLQEFSWKAKDLTWAGHEFLDGMRDQKVWNKCKATIRKKGVEFSLEAATQWLKAYLAGGP